MEVDARVQIKTVKVSAKSSPIQELARLHNGGYSLNLRDWIWSTIVILLMAIAVLSTQLDWAPNPVSYMAVVILSVIAATAFLCLCKIVMHSRLRRVQTSRTLILYSALSFIEVMVFCGLVAWFGWDRLTLLTAIFISGIEVAIVAYRFHSADHKSESSPTWRQALVHACLIVGGFPLLTFSLLGFQGVLRI